MPEPSRPEQRLREILLEKIYNGNKSQLENDVASEREQGSGNDLSALKKIVRVKGTVTLPDPVQLEARFIQLYHRKPRKNEPNEDRGYSAYLINNDGLATIHFEDRADVPDPRNAGLKMECGEPQLWSGLQQRQNIINGTKWLQAPTGVSVNKPKGTYSGKSLWQMAAPVNRVTDGVGSWYGWVSGVFPVAEWEDGERGEDKPILGDGGEANLSIGLSNIYNAKEGKSGPLVATTKIKNVMQLKTLLGEMFDAPMLMGEKAIGELRDSLNGQPVIAYGTGQTPGGNQIKDEAIRAKMKRPTIKLSGGLGLVITYEPDSETGTEN